MSRRYAGITPVPDRTANRPVVVDDLARLHGPRTGQVTLPMILDWTPGRHYDPQ